MIFGSGWKGGGTIRVGGARKSPNKTAEGRGMRQDRKKTEGSRRRRRSDAQTEGEGGRWRGTD